MRLEDSSVFYDCLSIRGMLGSLTQLVEFTDKNWMTRFRREEKYD